MIVLLLLTGLLAAQDMTNLSWEIKREPTTAQSVHPRFGALHHAFRERGKPPTPAQIRTMEAIKAKLGRGELTPAAFLLDELIRDVVKQDADAQMAAYAVPVQQRAEPALGDTPRLLSQPGRGVKPAASKPLLPPREQPAAAAAVAPAQMHAPDTTPARSGPPVVLLSTIGGALLIAMAFWAMRERPEQLKPPGKTDAPAPSPGGTPVRIGLRKPVQPPAPPVDLQPAPLLLGGKYEMGKPLAAGGMGEVCFGRDVTLGRRVAIKRLLADFRRDKELRSQFINEAKTVAKLNHPYIVQIHDCIEAGEEVYLVFEFVEGEPLSQMLAREARLPVKKCHRILGHVCEAIEFAHQARVLHRDLKPSNIMVGAGGIARVMDFGIAFESTGTLTKATTAKLDVAGTPVYMPPEQHHGGGVRASDVYALGVCLYEMATGTLPFKQGAMDDMLELKRARKYAVPSSLVPALGKDFDVLIAAALEPDPGHRIASAREFQEMLEAVAAKAV